MTTIREDDLRICIVMLTLNQCETTLSCLSNLMTIEEPPFDVLLWDNGSSDGTAKAVSEAFPRVLVHHHHENLGVAPGRNAAARLAIEKLNPTHLLFLDNDMFLEKDFISALLKPHLENDRVGQTQGKLRFMYDQERLNDGGGCKITWWLGQTNPVGYGEIDRGQYDQISECVACGGFMLVRRDVFEELGGFDEGFGVLGPDDLDFSLRLAKAGYKSLYVPDAIAYHAVTHTYGRDYNEKYAQLKAKNWFVFMRRHAPLSQRLAFYFLGAPHIIMQIVWREGKKGNIRAVRGLVRGALDYLQQYA
jgi:GT2 family glycosyltransferase